MKHLYRLFLLSCFAVFMSSCEKDLPTYSYSQNMLNFALSTMADTLQNHSFIYSKGSTVDTVWVTVYTLGYVVNEDRPIELQQVLTGTNDAQAGVHYVSFDDANLKKFYYIPANATRARIPIVLLKDASLTTQAYNLAFTFKTNDYFTTGYQQYSKITITVSNMLSKPKYWTSVCNYYFGKYGTVRHQFMIDASGYKWDDDFLLNVLHTNSTWEADQAYMAYFATFFKKKLTELNATREAQGLGKLAEADGTIITFSYAD